MYKRHKGFTLIELLAVIIILAIVALIATPIILDVIDDARTSAGRSEANMILGGINNYCASIEMKKQLGTLDSEDVDCSSKTSFTEEEIGKMVNLGNANVISNTYSNGKLTELVIKSNNHTFTLCPSGTFAMDDEECDGEVALEETPIIEKAKELVYENGACKTDGTTYQYMGGCYIKGNPTNNYIWYSGFLWRIMGVNADGTVRLITDENVTTVPYHENSSNWDDSYAKDWLNEYFYSRLKGNNIIKEETWCSETTTDSSSARITCTNNLSTETTRVGLLTLDEYNLAGGSSSYLNIGQYQWTMTPYSGSDAWGVRSNGDASNRSVSFASGLRAVINVNSNVTITGGNGTLGETWGSQSGPYILNESKSVEVTGKLNEKVTSGEYVLYDEKKYRVVDKDSNGNTKLILDGYYEEDGNIFKMKYNDTSTNVFSTTTGIGQKLNGDVLNWLTNNNESEKEKLVNNYTWYQNNFASGQSYTVSLNEESPTRSIQATVGLIRIGEMLSSQSSSILTKGYQNTSSYSNATTYWTMTPYSSSSAWSVDYPGNADDYFVSYTYGLRAVIVVNSDVTITSGNGTWSSPYQI